MYNRWLAGHMELLDPVRFVDVLDQGWQRRSQLVDYQPIQTGTGTRHNDYKTLLTAMG
jgi:hypothetical protein